MKKVLIVLLATVVFCLLGKISHAQGWYMIDSKEWKCVPASSEFELIGVICAPYMGDFSSPAEFIKKYKENWCWMVCALEVSDVRESGKVVQVSISYCPCRSGGSRCSIDFYRLERCKAVANKEKERERREQKKLKEYE